MSRALLIELGLAETRAALIEDGRLQALELWREDEPWEAGAIYLGRVARVVPSLRAAFVELGLARPGLLALGGGAPEEGAAVLVQLRRAPEAEKGALLTREVSLAGRQLAWRPLGAGLRLSRRITDAAEHARLEAVGRELLADGGGLVLRSRAAGAEMGALAAEAAALREGWRRIEAAALRAKAPALLHREEPVAAALREHLAPELEAVWLDRAGGFGRARDWCRRRAPWAEARLRLDEGPPALFERHGVEAEIEAALAPEVALPSGGRLAIETTRALTAVDVDSGARDERGGREAEALACNLEAAAALARQLRLRRIGGLVVVDFLRLAGAGDRAAVLAALDRALARDPTPTRRTGFSALGLVELARRRDGPALAERLGEPGPAAAGGRRRPSARTVAGRLLRRAGTEARAGRGGLLRLCAAPEVIAALAQLPAARPEALARAFGCRVALVGEPGFARERFEVARAAGGGGP